jgi:branched-chain amino acid transport system substrate-binding protein
MYWGGRIPVTQSDRADQPLTIGFQVPDDDVDALTGYCVAKMAIDEANAGGTLPGMVKLLPIPDWGNRDQARAAASAFVARPDAVAVLGPLNSDMALATQDIYHDAGLAQLTSEASSPLLTNQGLDNFFRLVANDEHQGRALARVAITYLGKSRIAVLHDGSGWGRPIAEIFTAEATRLGVAPVLVRGYGEREMALDFDDLVAETLRADVDLVYFAIYWNQAHIVTHKLRDAGNKAVFLGSDALKPYAFLEVPSLDSTPPHHTLAGVDIRVKPSAREFLAAFAARYPLLIDAPQYAAEANDCTQLLLEALRRAETTDRTGVLQALRGIRNFTGAIGPIAFDEHGDLVNPEIGLYQCQNGMRRYIGLVNELVADRTAS